MKRKTIWISAGLLVAAGLGWVVTNRPEAATAEYRFVEVTRGDLESTVTATGALQATETVEVGTQVSGQLAEIYVDFNDAVDRGQLLARIDPTILEQEVRSAEVNLARNQAEVDQTRRELDRTRELHTTQVVTDGELDLAEYQFSLADAAYRTAEINLERAQRNLQYTEIRAPIDGVVVSRNVEVGQTVAASLSAPVLFVLAQDLAEMEILASIDESDIGQIAEGQPVHFTVQAYPDREFDGLVEQVRLQSTMQENVVTYSVVVNVENRNGDLLPGMTATIDVVLEREEDVLIVPNTALRFRPSEEMTEAITNRLDEAAADRDEEDPGAVSLTGPPRGGPRGGQSGGAFPESRRPGQGPGAGQRGGGVGTLWYVTEDGELRVLRVRAGLTDGLQTVVVNPRGELEEGLQVVAAVTGGTPSRVTENPFQPQRQGFRRPGGF